MMSQGLRQEPIKIEKRSKDFVNKMQNSPFELFKLFIKAGRSDLDDVQTLDSSVRHACVSDDLVFDLHLSDASSSSSSSDSQVTTNKSTFCEQVEASRSRQPLRSPAETMGGDGVSLKLQPHFLPPWWGGGGGGGHSWKA